MMYSLCSLSLISAHTHISSYYNREIAITHKCFIINVLSVLLGKLFRPSPGLLKHSLPFCYIKKHSFNVLAKTFPAQQCLLTECIQEVHLQSTRHQGLRQLSEEAFEGSSHSVYGEVFLH